MSVAFDDVYHSQASFQITHLNGLCNLGLEREIKKKELADFWESVGSTYKGCILYTRQLSLIFKVHMFGHNFYNKQCYAVKKNKFRNLTTLNSWVQHLCVCVCVCTCAPLCVIFFWMQIYQNWLWSWKSRVKCLG